MVGDLIRAELQKSLDGDRNWIRTERKDGTVIRVNPEHIARVMAERARQRVEQDIALFRRTLNRRRNDNFARGREQLGI